MQYLNQLVVLLLCFATSTYQQSREDSRLQRRDIGVHDIENERRCSLYHYHLGGYVRYNKKSGVHVNTEDERSALIFKSKDFGVVTIQDPVTKRYICLGSKRRILARRKLKSSRCIFRERETGGYQNFYIRIPTKQRKNSKRGRKEKVKYLSFGRTSKHKRNNFLRNCKTYQKGFDKYFTRKELTDGDISSRKGNNRRHQKKRREEKILAVKSHLQELRHTPRKQT